ncbi:MAG: response regulator [Planctomycetaceae bacterium]|nr:response regulator [Planctomycetaceae bacterium]
MSRSHDEAAPQRLAALAEKIARAAEIENELRAEVARWQGNEARLLECLRQATLEASADRRSRQAALNLMEDAVRARGEILATNRELQLRITERLEAEAALSQSNAELTAAREEFRRLEAAFERRVVELTSEIEKRERRLRELATMLKRNEQQERKRLARLLHDHVQQLLVAAKMRIELVVPQADGASADLALAASVIAEAIEASRDLAVQLSPPLLHDQGLPAALHWLMSRMEKQHRLKFQRLIEEDADPADEEHRDILFQAAQEFMLNSAKYAGSERIICELRRSEGRLRLLVEDDGRGFDLAKGAESGSFGLFQVRQRLEAVGGLLVADSAPGRGTRMTAVIPIGAAAARNYTERDRPNPPEELMLGPADRISVVLVDDQKLIREALAQLIQREASILVVGEAGDGAAGLDVAMTCKPDVVLMDVNMPNMNGIEATRRITNLLPRTRIIGLTLDDSGEMEQRMREAGAIACLSKDCEADALIHAIHRVWANQAPKGSSGAHPSAGGGAQIAAS